MEARQPFYSRRIEIDHLILSRRSNGGQRPLRRRTSRIIRREEVQIDPTCIRIVGGDCADALATAAPAIVIEQSNGRIARILVTCPCGRHAELICDDEA